MTIKPKCYVKYKAKTMIQFNPYVISPYLTAITLPQVSIYEFGTCWGDSKEDTKESMFESKERVWM